MLAAAVVLTVVAVGGVRAFGAHSGDRTRALRTTARMPAHAPAVTAAARAEGPVLVPPSLDHGLLSSQAQRASVGGAAATTSSNTATTPTAAPTAALTDTARVVRTGALDLRVKAHTFGPTIGRITTIAAGAGGFISDEKTYESAAVPSGTVTLRVPSARFNMTVEKLRALGTVVSASTEGVDVTGEYIDLGARLTAATATRDQYLTVLAHATNIGDILSVQDRIQSVQTQIEQLQGQINQLNNQATYGTITASLSEPGPTPAPPMRPHHESGVAVAWGNARRGFSQRVEGLISHSGSALVVVLGLVVGLLLVGAVLRLLVPRMRRLLV
jgi:hypothetical protein